MVNSDAYNHLNNSIGNYHSLYTKYLKRKNQDILTNSTRRF